MAWLRTIVLAALATLAARAAPPEPPPADARLVAKDAAELAFLRVEPAVKAMLKDLPADYRLQPDVQYVWSDDEGKPIPHLVGLTPLDAAGKPDGMARRFGGEERRVPYVHGVKEGVEQVFAWHGKEQRLVSETPWVKGVVDGAQKVYHRENGKVMMAVPYVQGRRQGEARTFDLPGRLVKVTPYKDDKPDGAATEFYPGTTQAKKIIPYHAGKVHGVVQEFYEDGKLRRELPTCDDRFHGIEKTYDEHGKLAATRYWLNDEAVSPEQYETAGKK